jgi:hypothetical protein
MAQWQPEQQQVPAVNLLLNCDDDDDDDDDGWVVGTW